MRRNIALLCFGLMIYPLLAETDSTAVDSAKPFPEKMKAREPWEQVLALPGAVINLPFKLTMEAVSHTAGYVFIPGQLGPIYDLLHSDDGLRSLMPTASSRSGVGLKYTHKDFLKTGAKLQIKAMLGLRFRQKYQLTLKRLPVVPGKVYSDISIAYRRLVDESYFGLGNQSIYDNRSSYAQEKTLAEMNLNVDPIRKVNLSLGFNYHLNSVYDGKNSEVPIITQQFDPAYVPGLESGIQMAGVRVGAVYDNVTVNINHTRGFECALFGDYVNEISGSQFGFWKVGLDMTQHVHLFYGRGLKLRFAAEVTEPLENKRIPFYFLSEIGPMETMRGFRRGRYRDLDMFLGSVEYAYPIWHRMGTWLDAVVFVDAGKVTHDITENFSSDYLSNTFGGGFKLFHNNEGLGMFLIGKSDDGIQFYLTFNI